MQIRRKSGANPAQIRLKSGASSEFIWEDENYFIDDRRAKVSSFNVPNMALHHGRRRHRVIDENQNLSLPDWVSTFRIPTLLEGHHQRDLTWRHVFFKSAINPQFFMHFTQFFLRNEMLQIPWKSPMSQNFLVTFLRSFSQNKTNKTCILGKISM